MNITPEMIQAILGMGEADPQAEILKQQQMRANALRAQGMQQGSPVNMAGRVAIPNLAGPLQQGMSGYQARQTQPGIDQGQRDMGARNVQAKKGYLDALMMGMRKQVPPTAPILPPDGMEDQ